jgi:hypothetical protein
MPRRKALLIGINYFGTKYQLNGCINDAMNIREYLVERGFSPNHHDMVIMTDAAKNIGTPFEPTRANMMAVSLFSLHLTMYFLIGVLYTGLPVVGLL